MAEGIATRFIQEHHLNIRIDSAGTGDWHIGEAPCDNSIKVAKQHGIDISLLRARQVSPEDLQTFDLIIALDSSNYANLKSMGAKNLKKLGDFGFEGQDVPDPYFFSGFEGFEAVYAMIDKAISQLILSLSSKTNNYY